MNRPGVRLAACLLLIAVSLPAQTLPELFQKAKAQVKGEAWQDALKTLAQLDAESAKPGNENARAQLVAPLSFYRAVCEANLGMAEEARADFGAFLALQPNASMDPSMYSKKAIAAFRSAQETARPADDASDDDRPAMFTAFQEFKLPVNPGERADESWADGPIRWIMTAEEKRRWSEVFDGGQRVEFVERFWESRNPRPGNPDNVFKTTFERRVAFADAHFSQAEGKRGSLTDRGMVFVLLGPPAYVGRKPLRHGEDANEQAGMSTVGSRRAAYVQHSLEQAGEPAGSSPSAAAEAIFGPGTRAADSSPSWRETWHYRSELRPSGARNQQVDVEFITRSGYGVAVLQRDPRALAFLDAARLMKGVPK
jgi:GWxTD domain-containing protein